VKALVTAAATLLAAGTLSPRADDADTVQSLLSKGYMVVSSFMSTIGPGLFLQKEDSLYLCFASEKPDTKELTTKYCKPVH
jgi:hypothetical protein